jgi:GTP cyclohydrolase I
MPPRKSTLSSIGPAEIIADVQQQPSPRTIDIDKVGVKNISYPIVVLDKFNGTQHTVARINMYVNLPHRHKGTHMSRFIEILSDCRRDISIKNIESILE